MDDLKPETEMLDNGIETNLSGIARHVFSRPPGLPYSIGLQLDHPIDSDKTAEQVLQEMLTLFLLLGTQIKYGDSITFGSLNDEQKNVLRQYMWSTGYDPVIKSDSEGFWIEFIPYKV